GGTPDPPAEAHGAHCAQGGQRRTRDADDRGGAAPTLTSVHGASGMERAFYSCGSVRSRCGPRGHHAAGIVVDVSRGTRGWTVSSHQQVVSPEVRAPT